MTLEPPPTNRVANLTAEEFVERGTAASANQRVAIVLNLKRWETLPEEQQNQLVWFHQYCLDSDYTLDDCAQALGYDRSVAFRVLQGTYGPPTGKGSWGNIIDAIKSFRRLAENRANIQKAEFVPNTISRMIFAGLDYALANNSITQIVGESGQGKSIAAQAWRDANNHGRSVLITAPVMGGNGELLRRITKAIGGNVRENAERMMWAAFKGFNKHRILIVDEAHRLLPRDPRKNPVCLEMLRDIRDETGCALAVISTQRFPDALKETNYQYEQFLGRIGLPIRLPRLNTLVEIEKIVRQFVPKPTRKLLDACLEISNQPGRIRIMVERLKVASKIASKASRPMCEEDFFKALALIKQMGGEIVFAERK